MNSDVLRLKADYDLGNVNAGHELAVLARRYNDFSLMKEIFSHALNKGYYPIIDGLMKSMSDQDLIEIYDDFAFPIYKHKNITFDVTYNANGEEFSEQEFRQEYQHDLICRYFDIAREAIRRRIERWKRKPNNFGTRARFIHQIDTKPLIDICLGYFGFSFISATIKLAPISLSVLFFKDFPSGIFGGSIESLAQEWFEQELQTAHVEFEERRVNHLQTLHTRELLDYLNQARKFGGWYSPCDSGHPWGWAYDEIKAVLDTREHIPNAEERKELRRQKHKTGRYRGRKDR